MQMKLIIYRKFLLSLLCLLVHSTYQAVEEEWRYTTTEQIVSVGDIHGGYDAFISIMQKAELLDENSNWIGGGTHFVSTGDFLDRGPESRKVMDLFIKLEKQALERRWQVSCVTW